MKLKYSKEADILYITFVEKDVEESEYLEKEGMVVDFDKDSNMVGIEILSVSKKWPLEEFSRLYYEPAAG